MNTKKVQWLNAFVTMTLVMVLLCAGIVTWAQPTDQDTPRAEIEPELQAALEAKGQANTFIMFREAPDLSPAYNMPWDERGKFVYQALRQTANQSQARVRAYLEDRGITYRSFIIDNSIYVAGADLALTNNLATFSEVALLRKERSFPVPDVRLERDTNQVLAVEWGVAKINADDVWGLGYTGQGIVVANIDTGVRYTHDALNAQYRGNLGGSYNHTYSWYDPTGTYPSAPGDNHGHGSHTMGTMVGDDGGSNQIGVAPGAQWIACKGCTSTSCPDSYLNACADWMLAPGGNTSMRPQVVNNSWGGCTYDNWYRSKVTAWQAAGIHPVFSAGNTSNCGYSSAFCGSIGTPATYKEATAVGSTTSSDAISSFSLWGPSEDPTAPNEIKPEVSAPGSTIRSVSNSGDSSYTTMSGTSMAAPHVSGALALVWSACPSLVGDFDGTEQLMKDAAAKIAYATGCGNEGPGNIPNNAFGYGRIDVLAAVNACSTPVPTPTPGPSPTPTETPTPTPVPPILLVDDDAGSAYEGYYTAALGALDKEYDVWTVASQGSPSASQLQQYDIVIWFTGDDYSTTLTSTDQSNLSAYLNAGGNLFITGQDIGYDIRTASFYGNYLHASYVQDDTNTYGLTGYDILNGVNVTISGGDGANNQGYPSEIGLGTGAVGLYDYDGSYTWGGLRWAGGYQLVYFSFGYEAINASATRVSVMDAVLTWLEGGAPPTPTPTPVPPTPTSEPPTSTPTPEPPTPTTEPPTPTSTSEPPTPTSEPPTPTPTTEPPTPTPEPGIVFFDNFESDQGWVTNPSGSDTATTGMWERANPEETSYSGVIYQLGTTASGSYDLVTEGSAGSSVGSYDIDGGVTSIRSPDITLPSGGGLTLSFQYYLAHYTNGTSDDFLRVTVVGSTSTIVLEELASGDTDAAVWASFSTSLDAFAGQTVYLLIQAADAGSGSLIEAAIDDVLITSSGPLPTPTPEPPTPTPEPPTPTPEPPTPTPEPPTPTPTLPPSQVFFDDFESDQGWATNPSGGDTATTGMWERANPESTSYGGVTYQLGTTASGSYDLVTEGSAGSSVGSYDIDGGVTSIRSPDIALPSGGGLTLSFQYYLAHYTNGTSDDFLRVTVVGSTSTTVLEELASGDTDAAAWASFSTSLDAFAGQTVYLLIEAADAGSGSLIEAAIDDVSITSN